jgi:hypothetical protein
MCFCGAKRRETVIYLITVAKLKRLFRMRGILTSAETVWHQFANPDWIVGLWSRLHQRTPEVYKNMVEKDDRIG